MTMVHGTLSISFRKFITLYLSNNSAKMTKMVTNTLTLKQHLLCSFLNGQIQPVNINFQIDITIDGLLNSQ